MGVVSSVLRRLAPHAVVVHLSHEVAPHDVRGGGLLLSRAAPWLAPGVVLAVVDPGVGTRRRAVAVEAACPAGAPGAGAIAFVGPDNGLLVPALDRLGGAGRAVRLEGTYGPGRAADPVAGLQPGPTFDGRDVFAPAAAALCNGTDLGELGPSLDPGELVAGPSGPTGPTVAGPGEVVTEVVWVDRFGNAQLGAGPDDLAGAGPVVEVELAGATSRRHATRVRAFADLAPGEPGLVVDSTGLLALVLDRRPAAAELGLVEGDRVVLRWEPPAAGRSGTGSGRPAGGTAPQAGGSPASSRRRHR